MRAAGAWCCAVFVVTGCTGGMSLAGDIGDRDRVTPADGADADSPAEDDAGASYPDAVTGSDGQDVPLACGNGALDRDEECDGDPPRICARPGESCGLRLCRADCLWSTCGPADEICNGHDDDCDGATDEGAWCRVHPLPSARDLRSAWALASSDVWAVGDLGTAIRWDGSDWRDTCTGTRRDLRGVWGRSLPGSPGELWAVGDGGTAVTWTGDGWSPKPVSTGEDLQAVWGFDSGEVWAVGTAGVSARWDGTSWSVLPTGSTAELRGLWGASPDDLWAVGTPGAVAHWTGAEWTSWSTPAAGDLNDLWGFAADDIWIAAAEGLAYHWDGAGLARNVVWEGTFGGHGAWSPGPDLISIWGASPDDVWAGNAGWEGMAEWDGSRWATRVHPGDYDAGDDVSGTSATDAWAVGTGGAVQHWDGTDWRFWPARPDSHDVRVWAASPDDVWAITYGTALHFTSGRWTEVALPGPVAGDYWPGPVWGFGPGWNVILYN